MSKVLTEFALFEVRDFTDTITLSSYSLDITPLKFIAILDNDSMLERVEWSFGDGTYAHGLTASHVYDRPGKYKVEMVVYDCYGQSRLATYSDDVTIFDYIENTFTIDADIDPVQVSNSSSDIVINSYTPHYLQMQDINISISNSASPNYFSLDKKYRHLEPFNSVVYTNNIEVGEELVDLDKIDFQEITNIYVEISGSDIIQSTADSNSSTYAGASATRTVQYKDDTVTDDVNISFYKDLGSLPIIGANNLSLSLTGNIIGPEVPHQLTITSNGLDGEGIGTINSFDIDGVKIMDIGIPFVIKSKDINNFTLKHVNIADDINIEVRNESNTLPASAWSIEFDDRTEISGNHFVSGNAKIISSGNHSLSGLYIYADSLGGAISGVSTSFTAVPDMYYDMYRHTEDYDFTQTIKDLRFQEILLDDNVFFDDFIGSIFGTDTSSYNTLGKKLMERITNFNTNIVDVDTSEISNLISTSNMIGGSNDVFDTSLMKYPNSMKRVINLLSTSKKNLVGYENQFTENYDAKGITTREEYGINLGEEIDPLTYTVSSSANIVALEKFSGTYDTLNTMQPVSAIGSHTYSLSGYSDDWGWPLVLPNTYTPADLGIYYNFYLLDDSKDGSIIGGLIDFENSQTTVDYNSTYNDFVKEDGISDVMLVNTLFNSLSIT